MWALALTLVACGVLLFVTEPVYRSVATLKIMYRPTVPSDAEPLSDSEFAQMQMDLIRSPSIVGRAIEDAHLMQVVPELEKLDSNTDPVQWIAARLEVTRRGRSELFNVSLDAPSPDAAQRIVDAVVTAYLRYVELYTVWEKAPELQQLVQDLQADRPDDPPAQEDGELKEATYEPISIAPAHRGNRLHRGAVIPMDAKIIEAASVREFRVRRTYPPGAVATLLAFSFCAPFVFYLPWALIAASRL